MDMQSPFKPGDEFDRLVKGTSEDAGVDDSTDTSDAGPELFFPNLEVFVTDFLIHHYARPVDPMGQVFCGGVSVLV